MARVETDSMGKVTVAGDRYRGMMRDRRLSCRSDGVEGCDDRRYEGLRCETIETIEEPMRSAGGSDQVIRA